MVREPKSHGYGFRRVQCRVCGWKGMRVPRRNGGYGLCCYCRAADLVVLSRAVARWPALDARQRDLVARRSVDAQTQSLVPRFHMPGLGADLLQEGRLGVVRAALDYDPARGATFETLAHLVAQRRMTRFVQGERDYRRLFRLGATLPEPKPGAPAVTADERIDLDAAIGQLSLHERVLLRLIYWEGLTAKEIAKALGFHHSLIYRRLDKILVKLREMLEPAGS